MRKKGTVYFFTGLAGAGKTTLGTLFYRRMKEKNNNVVLLDGDQLRRLSTVVSGYTTEERRSGAYFNFELAELLTNQNIDVVLCSISMYDDVRAWAREHIENYVEIYIKVKWETLYKRDQKWTCCARNRKHRTSSLKTMGWRRPRPSWSGWKRLF